MDELKHIGTPRHSGRYPWGSGVNPYQSYNHFITEVNVFKAMGLSPTEIAKKMNMKVAQLRARTSYGQDEKRIHDFQLALKLRDKGWSYTAISDRLGMKGESSVRSLLEPDRLERAKITYAIADVLRKEVEANKYIDVGKGMEHHLGVSNQKLKVALIMLEDEGYMVHSVPIPQLGTGKNTNMKTLCPPGTEWKEAAQHKYDVKLISLVNPSHDYGRTFQKIETPVDVDSRRVAVRYSEDGGGDKDGIIELRRGVEDISLGNANYAQVRIAVDGTHYLKGMAVYGDDFPKGVDMIFNTNKNPTDNKMDAMKPMKIDDPENPFGASIKLDNELIRAQRYYTDKKGELQQSALNIVNEEGNWNAWSKNLSSQVLSKQRPEFAKQQLELEYEIQKAEYEDLKVLTNPIVQQRLLQSYADGCDSAAVYLKAAAMPRQNTHVLLPIPSLKDTEVYAPNYDNGEQVILLRHPHGGRFEIPELIVNNKNREAKMIFKGSDHLPFDAVGISPKVAQQLSGADFDGDAVIVIPNKSGSIKTAAALKALSDFDPISAYPAVKGMKVMGIKPTDELVTNGTYLKGAKTDDQMGNISNLITDMTIKGATWDNGPNISELARAVKHSMVVIDAEKHKLNYEQSAIDNDIKGLKQKYQGKSNAGASTVISRAKSPVYVDQRYDHYATDPLTGKPIYKETGKTYTNKKGEVLKRKTTVPKILAVDDAFELSSGTRIESIYATHANKLKALANMARKDAMAVKPIKYEPSAAQTYNKEVISLESQLKRALQNAPLERQATVIANSRMVAIKKDNPGLEESTLKKLRSTSMQAARVRVGAKKYNVIPTEKEWEAIQAGAITKTRLKEILFNTDLDRLKELAMPRELRGISTAKLSRAKSMMKTGYTQAEVADHLGVSLSTLLNALQNG